MSRPKKFAPVGAILADLQAEVAERGLTGFGGDYDPIADEPPSDYERYTRVDGTEAVDGESGIWCGGDC